MMSAAAKGQQHAQQEQQQSLTACNEELLGVLQDLRARRADVHRDVERAEAEKAQIQRQIAALNERLTAVTAGLAGQVQARAEYDRTIRETELAYAKILESSATLLRVLRREATHLAAGAAGAVAGSVPGAAMEKTKKRVGGGAEPVCHHGDERHRGGGAE